ncbi:histidine kinase [Robertmurraya yapensis]|uniref:Histidine kinase n=2 Tax=Bacillaceae TaxID=186817 RepID=A0A431WEB6_9BACI|nr:histidine kinase [Bacillus yapensis]RTR33863.1 histidine kinase [Bacillus yapensis]TKS97181.1 histidine kinase [Bacillus yapensis]
MKTKRITLMMPIMIIVGIAAFWMLDTGYSEISSSIQLIITLGAVVLSGIISYFLFPENEKK